MRTVRGAILPGGGMKGYLTLAIINNFEATYGVSFFDYFDVCYSASTGGLIGSLLLSGVPRNRISDLYLYHGEHIFTRQNSLLHPWDRLWEPRYDRNRVLGPYKELMQEVHVTKFGQIQKMFACVSVDQCSKQNMFLKNTSDDLKDRNVEEIIARTFAAPLYFGKYVDPVDGSVWSDGGSGDMNTPIDPCYNEVFNMAKPGDNIEIIMFGTGISDHSVSKKKAQSYNKFAELWNFYFAEGEQLARIQAYHSQVNGMKWKAKRIENLTFKAFDLVIPKKMDIIDGWKYLNEYRELGNSVKIY